MTEQGWTSALVKMIGRAQAASRKHGRRPAIGETSNLRSSPCPAISLTWSPISVNRRAQCFEPPQASIPIRQGARFAKCSRNFARLICLLKTSPVSGSTRYNWTTFSAISTPYLVKFTVGSPFLKWSVPTFPLWHIDAVGLREPTPSLSILKAEPTG